MKLIEEFAPRDAAMARHLIAVLTLVAAGVTIAASVLGLASTDGSWPQAALIGPPLVLIGAFAIWVLPEVPGWLWAAYPIGAPVVIAVTNLATNDATVTAQIFFFFPVLYAGAQLRPRAGLVITGTSAVAELAVTFVGLPPRVALVDSAYMIAAMAAAAGLLVRASERADALVVQLREQAAIDSLTGLVTRRVLDSAASSALKSAASGGGTALLLIDLDRFKNINDVHGHLAGDLVLQQVSAVLDDVGRRTDVVCRMGGDEFAMLMSGCPLEVALERAESVVERLRALRIDVSAVTMDRPGDEPVVLGVTASVGLAHLPTHASDLHELYRSADMSLYRAKRNGRNQVADLDLDAA